MTARIRLPLFILALTLGSHSAPAQSLDGTLRGHVLDSSGAVIPQVAITIRDIGKGVSFPTRSDALGLYQAELPRGTYEIEASAPGFASVRQTGIAISLGETVVIDLTLPVTAFQGFIDVLDAIADMSLIKTADGTLSGLVDRELLAELPLNGRDYGSLALLQPGVVLNNNGANSPFGGKWANFVINGQLDQATLFLMDGSEITDTFSGRTPSGSSGLLLGLDGVQEFQVLLNNYKAEFGKNSGGVVRVATRSGSNDFHGSVFEYLRNSRLDAGNFFDLPGPIPPFQRNQFGLAFGGPLRRDRSFFFLNYEGLRERKSITSVSTVPTSDVRSAAAPAVVPFLNLYPFPNGPLNPDGMTASLTSSVTQPAREDFGLVRLDHRANESVSLLARVSVQDSFLETPFPSTPVPGFPQGLPHRNVFSLLGATAAVGPSAVNEFHFAFNRTFQDVLLPPPPDGLTISPVPGRDFGLIIVPGISNLGTQTFVRTAALNLFEISDKLSIRRGRHSQKYGVDIQRYQANEQRASFFNGQYSFSNVAQFLSLAAAPPAPTPLFVGVLGGTNASGPASPAGWRWTAFNGFAQDDIQLLPNLTVNLGIRYEFSSTPSEVNGLIANLRSPLDAQVNVGGQLFNTIARSWAPRVGFAWSPFSGRDAVLRGGYGVFFNPLVVNMYANSRLVPPFVEIASILHAPFPNPLATGLAPNRSTTGQSIDYTLSQPYTQHWNLQWQQRVSSNWVASAAYVGNRTLHLIRSLEANSAIPVIEEDGTKFFPLGVPRRNPNFGAIRGRSSNGNSWYNALQVTLEKRYSNGWDFEAAYTWGKSLSTGDSSFTTLPSQPSNTQDPEDPSLDKALSAFDTRHRLVTHILWQVPRLGNSTARSQWARFFGGAIENWSVSAIASFSSGYPFSVINGFNRSRNQQSDATIIADRPDWNPDFRGNPILGDPARWFDPAAFVLQPAGYYGNVPRNALIGPGFANLDLSLGKKFDLGEPREFEFRADFFNLTNRPNFATPSSSTGAQIVGGVIVFPDASGSPAGNAGQIFRTVTDARQIQFSLRFRF